MNEQLSYISVDANEVKLIKLALYTQAIENNADTISSDKLIFKQNMLNLKKALTALRITKMCCVPHMICESSIGSE